VHPAAPMTFKWKFGNQVTVCVKFVIFKWESFNSEGKYLIRNLFSLRSFNVRNCAILLPIPILMSFSFEMFCLIFVHLHRFCFITFMEAVQPDVSGRFLTLSFPVFVYVHARVDVFTRTSLSFPFVSPQRKNVNRCHPSSSRLHIYIQVVIIKLVMNLLFIVIFIVFLFTIISSAL
jgi:hypothetical protein